MSNYSDANVVCETILATMDFITGAATPESKLTPFGATAAILDTQSDAQAETLTLGRRGHKGTGRVRYYQRSTEDQTSAIPQCDNPNPTELLEQTFTYDQYREISFRVDAELIRHLCADSSIRAAINGSQVQPVVTPYMRELARIVMKNVNGLLQAINTDNINAMIANIGNNLGNDPVSTDCAQYPVFNNLCTGICANGLGKLLTDYYTNEGEGLPHIIGNGKIGQAMRMLQGAGIDQYGINVGRIAEGYGRYYQDFKLPGLLGNEDDFLIIEPSTYKIFQLLRNGGDFGGTFGNEVRTVYNDPRLGNALTFDMAAKWVSCGNAELDFQVTLSMDWHLWKLPSDAYASGDRLNGVTGTWCARATQGA